MRLIFYRAASALGSQAAKRNCAGWCGARCAGADFDERGHAGVSAEVQRRNPQSVAARHDVTTRSWGRSRGILETLLKPAEVAAGASPAAVGPCDADQTTALICDGSCKEMPQVEAACTSLTGQAIVSAGTVDLGVDMRGVVPLEQEACTPLGRYVQSGSWRTLGITPDGIAMGSGVADKLGSKPAIRVRIVAPGGLPQNLKVVAIYEAGVPPIDKTRVYVNLTTAQTVLRRRPMSSGGSSCGCGTRSKAKNWRCGWNESAATTSRAGKKPTRTFGAVRHAKHDHQHGHCRDPCRRWLRHFGGADRDRFAKRRATSRFCGRSGLRRRDILLIF